MKKLIFVVMPILFIMFYQNAYAVPTPIDLKLHLDKQQYSSGDTVRILAEVIGPPEKLTNANVRVIIAEGDFGFTFNEKKPYEGKPIEFTYAIPQNSTYTYYWIEAELSVENYLVTKDTVIVTKTGTNKIVVSDVTIDKTAVRPADFINVKFKVMDGAGNTVKPDIAFIMLCKDDAADDCRMRIWIRSDEDPVLQARVEIPDDYEGSYKLKIGVIPAGDTEYMPAEHLADIKIGGEPLPNWLRGCGEAVHEICVDYDTMGSGDKSVKPGGSFPIHVKIQPNNKLQVKVYDPLLALISDETFQADNEGFVSAEYKVPNETMVGHYNVLMITTSDMGKAYHQGAFHIGGTTPWGSPISAGEILFQFEPVMQEGTTDQYSGIYLLNKTITVSLKTVTPYPREIIPNHPVNITLSGPDGRILDRVVSRSDGDGNLLYTFTPSRSGHYKMMISSEYETVSDARIIKFPVAMVSNYTILAEGREFPIIFEGDWYHYMVIKNVTFSQPAKRLSFEVANTEIFHRLQVRIPYELLNEPYIIFIDGEPIKTDIFNDYNSAVVYIPVDDTVNRVDIVGTGVIPEFPISLMIISVAIGVMLSIVAVIKRRRGSEFMRDFE